MAECKGLKSNLMKQFPRLRDEIIGLSMRAPRKSLRMFPRMRLKRLPWLERIEVKSRRG